MTPEERRKAQGRARSARYRAAHPDRIREQTAARDVESVRAASARWREQNRDKDRARAARRAREKPEVFVMYAATRRARMAASNPDLTLDQWNEILDEFDNACAYCQARDVPMEVEHVTPISRGGRHTKSNVVPACRSCNARKGAKTLLEFAAVG